MAPDIQIKKASLSYQQHSVFKDIDLTIAGGRHAALLGKSGVGKTSFLRMLAGLTTKDEQVTGHLTASNHLPLSAQIAYMSQQDSLLPWLNTFANITLSLSLRRHSRAEMTRKTALANQLLHEAGLDAAHSLYPHQLSGGMRQRAALVRTLLEEQPIVLMDEPFSALDAITRHQLQLLAKKMLRDKTVVLITHDPAEALIMADDIYLLSGRPANLQLLASQNHQVSATTQKDKHDLYDEIFERLILAEQTP